MSESLPGVYVERREGALATALPVSLNTLAIVGTANRGPINTPIVINSVSDAYDIFGFPDVYDGDNEGQELSLTRGIQIANDAGASYIYATRVASSSAAKATRILYGDGEPTHDVVTISAASEGTWGNDLQFKAEIADGQTTLENHVDSHSGFVEDEDLSPTITQTAIGVQDFYYYAIISAANYYADASANNAVVVTYQNGPAVAMIVQHSDAHLFLTSGEATPTTHIFESNDDLIAQTFTTIDSVWIKAVRLRIEYATVVPATGDMLVAIKAVDGSTGQPTGSVLVSKSLDMTTFDGQGALGLTYATKTFVFATAYKLDAETMYAIEVTSSGGWTATAQVLFGGFRAAQTATDANTYTKGVAWFNPSTGYVASDGVSGEIQDWTFDLVHEMPEGYCELVIKNWGTSYPSAQLKHIRWSDSNTPTSSDDITTLDYYTAESRLVTLKYGDTKEKFWVVDGNDLVTDITANSRLCTAAVATYPTEEVEETTGWQQFGIGTGTAGNNGAIDVASTDYEEGFASLEQYYVHVLSAAGRFDRATISALVSHCENMAEQQKERVAVAGHGFGKTLAEVMASSGAYASERLSFVSPGILRTNAFTGDVETLSAAYAAQYLAGWLTRGDISESNLYKTINAAGLETYYTKNEADQVAQRRINPITEMAEGGYKWRESITTSTDTALREITTVRIVDFASYGLRSVLNSFIGKKNLPGMRSAIFNSCTGFLKTMKNRQMLYKNQEASFTVDVLSNRDNPTMVDVIVTIRPVFAIKYIRLIFYVR